MWLGIALHEADQFVVDGVAQAVDRVVGGQHAARQLRIACHERVEALAAPWTAPAPAMCGMSIIGLTERMVHQRKRALGDVHREIAHALQVGVDLERRGEEAQVARHGLLQGQQADRQVVDLHLHLVDAGFVAEDLLGQLLGPALTSADAAMDGGFHQRAHLQQLLVAVASSSSVKWRNHVPSVSVPSACRLYPNRPVM